MMEEIVKTVHLEYEKSAFLIDLVKHNNGQLFVEIVQTINSENKIVQSIKINPSILPEIINVLLDYQTEFTTKPKSKTLELSYDDQQKIQDRYLKGVPIKDIAMQYGRSPKLIEMILRNRGIEIVSNKIPYFNKWKKRKGKK